MTQQHCKEAGRRQCARCLLPVQQEAQCFAQPGASPGPPLPPTHPPGGPSAEAEACWARAAQRLKGSETIAVIAARRRNGRQLAHEMRVRGGLRLRMEGGRMGWAGGGGSSHPTMSQAASRACALHHGIAYTISSTSMVMGFARRGCSGVRRGSASGMRAIAPPAAGGCSRRRLARRHPIATPWELLVQIDGSRARFHAVGVTQGAPWVEPAARWNTTLDAGCRFGLPLLAGLVPVWALGHRGRDARGNSNVGARREEHLGWGATPSSPGIPGRWRHIQRAPLSSRLTLSDLRGADSGTHEFAYERGCECPLHIRTN